MIKHIVANVFNQQLIMIKINKKECYLLYFIAFNICLFPFGPDNR